MDEVSVLEIEKIAEKLIPWRTIGDYCDLNSYLMSEPEIYLRPFHLFSLSDLTLPSDHEDIGRFINERYQTVLSAAYYAKISIMTVIKGGSGRVKIYIGFRTQVDMDPESFKRMVEGALPGSKPILQEMLQVDNLMDGMKYGGLITGIPTLKVDEERQFFNLASVIRSMYGRNYTLMIIADPIEPEVRMAELRELINIRDESHKIAKQTLQVQEGGGKSKQKQKSITKTNGNNIRRDVITNTWVNLWGGISGKTESKIKLAGSSTSDEQNWSKSLSHEQQNGLAIELEKFSDSQLDRIKRSINFGYWEVTTTYSTAELEARDILTGSYLGQLSRPTPEISIPLTYIYSQLDNLKVLIPKTVDNQRIFPKPLCSYMSSEELAMIACPPIESVPGFEIKEMPSLCLTDDSIDNLSLDLGRICDYGKPIEDSAFYLSNKELGKHCFVTGLTGSGKTTTVKQLLKQSKVPFLVLESAKRDYRQLMADDYFKNRMRVYTIGDVNVSPIYLNPFYILPGVSPLSHIDYLKSIFNASFSLYGPMSRILEKCLHNVYIKHGWNLTFGKHPFFLDEKGNFIREKWKTKEHYYCFPTLNDLKREVNNYVRNMEYDGELSDNIRTAIVTRLESLSVGSKGLLFDTNNMIDVEELLQDSVVFEMEALSDDDDKAFFMGLILTFLSEYRQQLNPTTHPWHIEENGLNHILVIEEAHRLLKNVSTERTSELLGNPKGKAVEFFCNVIAEMRALGQGVIVVEQIPSKIASDVIKNTNTKIVHRLVARDDQLLLAGTLGLKDDDSLYLTRLKTGFALCHKEGMNKPAEVQITGTGVKEKPISDDTIQKNANPSTKMPGSSRNTLGFDFQLADFSITVDPVGEEIVIRFLNSLLIGQEHDVRKFLDEACRLLYRKCMENNYGGTFPPAVCEDYIIHSILKLFSTGIYSRNYAIPVGLFESLKKAIKDKDANSIGCLKALLNKYWRVADTAEAIIEIVARLILNLIEEYLKEIPDHQQVVHIVSSYFLFFDPETVAAVQLKVKGFWGEDND